MNSSQEKSELICYKCQVPLQDKKIFFNYLGFQFNTVLPACPVCGQIYLSEELVKGKVYEVEMSLEDK